MLCYWLNVNIVSLVELSVLPSLHRSHLLGCHTKERRKRCVTFQKNVQGDCLTLLTYIWSYYSFLSSRLRKEKTLLKCLSPMTTTIPKREINADGTKKSTTTVDSPKCEFPCSWCWVETGVRANRPWTFFRRTQKLVSWAWYTCANPCTTKTKKKKRKKERKYT